MAALTTTNITEAAPLTDLVAGLTAAAGGGDTFTYNERTFFVINNGGVGSITATFAVASGQTSTTKSSFGTLTKSNLAVAVGAGKIAIVPMLNQCFKNTSGNVAVTYSGVTSVTVNPFNMEALT